MTELLQVINDNILVETIDEWLSSFTVQNFNIQARINQYNNIAILANRIGTPSAVGAVYRFPANPDYVLKVSKICSLPVPVYPVNYLVRLCQLAREGDIIFRIPNTFTGKKTILAPDYIVEPLIGLLLRQYIKYTPSFMYVEDFQYDPINVEKPVYIKQETLVDISHRIQTQEDFKIFAFQIIQGLHVAQETCRYVHYDLHDGNIMARQTPGTTCVYDIGNGNYFYTRVNFNAVIIDYGQNRMETDNSILSPRLSTERAIYNPYYDIFTFLYRNYMKANGLLISRFAWANQAEIDVVFLDLFSKFFNVNLTQDSLDELLIHILGQNPPGPNTWRPIISRLATEYNITASGQTFRRTSKSSEMMVHIASSITTTPNAYIYMDNRLFYPTDDTNFYPLPEDNKRMENTYYNYTIKERDSIGVTPIIGVPIIEITSNVDVNGIAVSATQFGVREEVAPYNDPSDISYDRYGIIINGQAVHAAVINTRLGKEKGYKFHFDCCRIDIKDYFQTQRITSGIAINGGFFNISTNFLPVGKYNSQNFFNEQQIPQQYRDYYGIVGIDQEGDLQIIRQYRSNNFIQFMTVGPMLVENGVSLITDATMNLPIFQCRKLPPPIGYNSCSTIQPGEFSHGANRNPRTALGIKANGDIIFCHVEGRNNRGVGMDLFQLAQQMVYFDAIIAINLDGGRSSQMMWKKQGESLINQAGPSYDDTGHAGVSSTYPVGNILSYISETSPVSGPLTYN